MPSQTGSADDLTLALTDAIRTALEALPRAPTDTPTTAARLAGALAARISDAAAATGIDAGELARALAGAPPSRTGGSAEERVLAALGRHTAGRSPGVTPESLATLTGLPQSVLAAAVSALVQGGELVRDAWLVRLPHAEDLLPEQRPRAEEGGEMRQLGERRAIGDRRATGERRLYDRRAMREE